MMLFMQLRQIVRLPNRSYKLRKGNNLEIDSKSKEIEQDKNFIENMKNMIKNVAVQTDLKVSLIKI